MVAGFKHLAAYAASQSLLSCFLLLSYVLAFAVATPVRLDLFALFDCKFIITSLRNVVNVQNEQIAQRVFVKNNTLRNV